MHNVNPTYIVCFHIHAEEKRLRHRDCISHSGQINMQSGKSCT